MLCYSEQQFIRALRRDPERRTIQDLQVIYSHLASIEALSKLRESALRSLCTMVRYERHSANDILYCRGEMASCWYILLSGAVFIDGSMYLPRSSFGKRVGGAARRHNECLILEPSEMIVIDYVDGRARTERITDSSSTTVSTSHSNNNGGGGGLITEVTIQPHNELGTFVDSSDGGSGSPPPPPHPPRLSNSQQGGLLSLHSYHLNHHHLHHGHQHRSTHHHHGGGGGVGNHSMPPPGRPPSGTANSGDSSGYHSNNGGQHKTSLRSSRSSDSSSAYSGSDTMQSPNSSSSAEVEEVDLSGLMESVVDSDEDEDGEDETSLLVRDAVRECLEKDPSDRTAEDVDTLLEFTQHLKAFTNMTLSVRRALVATMVFAVVEKAGTVVMTDGEELDSWSVIINGHVEVVDNHGETRELHLGDSFGITPTMEKLYHKGVMRTKCDDCQFVCVTQTDYYRILHQGEESQKRHEEDGKVVLVTENRASEADPNRRGHLVIRGSTQRLMNQLMEDNSDVDATYIEDFLLTYRTFLKSPTVLANQLLDWFADPSLRDKVTRVLLLWVNNHFTDFETDPAMMEFLEQFETSLEKEKMQGQLRMLNFACAAKARKRTVTLTRPSRDEPLQFSIVGGFERGFGIFIAKVERSSKAEEIGLKRGDQILEVNGQSFEHGTKYARAVEILKGVCHLSVTVKSNLLAFQEMLQTPEDTPRSRSRGKSTSGRIEAEFGMASSSEAGDGRSSSMSTVHSNNSREHTPNPSSRSKGQTASAAGHPSTVAMVKGRSKINRAFNRFLHKPKSLMSVDTLDGEAQYSQPHSMHFTSNSLSNPDLLRDNSTTTTPHLDGSDAKSEYPEHVLKVYKSDQTFKYLLVHKETTAHEVVMLSLQEFGITEPSSNFSLCEVSVSEGGFVKQRTLPDALQNLAERIGLASRYYIKSKNSSESLLPDDNVNDLVKDSVVSLHHLNPVEVSTQLMVEDFTIFRQIEATEYVDDLYELESRYGMPSLTLFAELVNREMMWTIGEIVSENNATKRMRIIKQFIKIARQCKETQNFNSMFAIISGLGHGAVSRLKSSWEKLPSKYQRLFNEMQQLMDPSRNMSRYRNLVNGEDVQPPIVPFYPVVKKDLTFIHLANDTYVDDLVNFEKLRMIAKEVRGLINMCSAPLDLFSMLELGGQQPSNAMVAMNQLTTGGQNLATVNRRRKKPQGVPNPKRMFEEAQMVRRVKAYLKNMKVITDEEKLLAMSMECEPPSGGAQLAQPSLRKRNPSPTPSAVSSTSSGLSEKKLNGCHGGSATSLHPPKFGAASPQAVKKLLALSETSKTRPKAMPSTPSPLSKGGHGHAGGSIGGGGGGSGTGSSTAAPTTSSSTSSTNHHHHQAHHHHHSLTNSVDLTAESSSVTSLPSTRKTQTNSNNNNSGSVTSNDSGVGFFNDNHNAELAPPLPRHHSRTQRPPPPPQGSRHRLKVPSPRVAVHHALPEGIMHRTRNADHSILINNRLVLGSSTPKPPPSLLRKNVFYHPDEDDETQVSAV